MMTKPGVEGLGTAGWPECGEKVAFKHSPQLGWGWDAGGGSQRWRAEGTLQPVLAESRPSTARPWRGGRWIWGDSEEGRARREELGSPCAHMAPG